MSPKTSNMTVCSVASKGYTQLLTFKPESKKFLRLYIKAELRINFILVFSSFFSLVCTHTDIYMIYICIYHIYV